MAGTHENVIGLLLLLGVGAFIYSCVNGAPPGEARCDSSRGTKFAHWEFDRASGLHSLIEPDGELVCSEWIERPRAG